MIEQVEEIAELIAPRMFGKKLGELQFFEGGNGISIEKSELFACMKKAGEIRIEALEIARKDFGRDGNSMMWPQLLQICEIIIERIDKEKAAK